MSNFYRGRCKKKLFSEMYENSVVKITYVTLCRSFLEHSLHTCVLSHEKNSREIANDAPGSDKILRIQTDGIRARRNREILRDLVSGPVGTQNPRRGGQFAERRLRRRERQLQQGPARSYLLQVSAVFFLFFFVF